MSIYRFYYERGPGDPGDHAELLVAFDDATDASLDQVVGVFVQFLKGVSFEPDSIKKFIDPEMV